MPLPQNLKSVNPAATNPADVKPEKSQVLIGFDLAKIVLSMTAGSIVLFLIYLVFMESTISSDIRRQYRHILVPNRLAAEMMTTAGLEQLSKDLGHAKTNPSDQWSAESEQNAENILKLIKELPSIGSEQKSQMSNCIPPPPDKTKDTDRDNKIETCLNILGGIRQAMLVAADASADAKVAGDATFKIGEQRKDLHTFWVQAAQLVLLNLLLPLLTALFGYIFGRQQEQQQKS